MLNFLTTGHPSTARPIASSSTTSPAAVDDAALARLRARLAERADADGLLDVAYRTMDSPVGPLLLAATPAGLVRVAFECENHDDVLVELSNAISPRILRSPRRVDDVARQLDEYFAGRRRRLRGCRSTSSCPRASGGRS